jgi:hypothetical protein
MADVADDFIEGWRQANPRSAANAIQNRSARPPAANEPAIDCTLYTALPTTIDANPSATITRLGDCRQAVITNHAASPNITASRTG